MLIILVFVKMARSLFLNLENNWSNRTTPLSFWNKGKISLDGVKRSEEKVSFLSICKWKAASDRRIQLDGPVNPIIIMPPNMFAVESWSLKMWTPSFQTFCRVMKSLFIPLVRNLKGVITHHAKICVARWFTFYSTHFWC